MSLGARRRRPPTPRFVANELYRAAGEVPSFHIAPARTQNARDLITGSVLGSYNSASPAWAVGPDGVLFQSAANAPVIEYDSATLQCLGARIWGAVTNLLLRSEELGNAAWSRAALTVSSDVTTSPKGTQDADKLVESATNAEHITWQPRSAQSETMTLSVFAKASERSRIKLGFSNFATAACGAFFNLSTGVVISTDAANADYTSPAASIFAYPAGWYRCVFTVTKGTANTTNNPFIDVVNNSNQTSYLGDGTSGVFAIGGQLQTGSVVGPYAPTTATTASSTADVWDITSLTAGINNLKTIYFRGRTSASGTRGIASLNDNSSSNRLELSTSGTDPKATAVTSGSTVADLNGGTIAANSTFRLAVRFDTDSYALSLNGGAVTTDTSGARALVDRLFIGRDQAGNYQNGYLEEFAGWTRACTDAQLSALAAS